MESGDKMSKFQNEQEIRALFVPNNIVTLNGIEYKILRCEKPKVNGSRGEPKTDAYILFEDIHYRQKREIKLTIKKANADFLENKVRPERAEVIFGPQWKEKITSYIKLIKEKFLEREILYNNGRYKGSITLGWRFEIVNKTNGELSAKANLNYTELLEVYSGPNLEENKKNAKIGKDTIPTPESGVADYIVICTESYFKNAQDVIDSIQLITEYIKNNQTVYFVCKALNYLTFEDKIEGNRSLSVYINWENRGGRLTPEFVFDNPLSKNGSEIRNKLKQTLAELYIKTTDDIGDIHLNQIEKSKEIYRNIMVEDTFNL
ncbi:hypothetical protein [Niallia sp. 03133]|uniref:hypothetical protein n=1 Tax=Niallia sp. 03133 TaxID=3458060 RepID=UPI004044B593